MGDDSSFLSARNFMVMPATTQFQLSIIGLFFLLAELLFISCINDEVSSK